MNTILLIVFSTFWGSIAAFAFFHSEAKNPTLKLVHLMFRHGNRNPDKESLFTSSPYYNESNYPEGYGQLTNEGKTTEFKIGDYLRQRYADFLTTSWYINYVDSRSTDVNRTKMSLELMLAGLYPPRGSQIWSLLFWQPIPISYVPSDKDKEMYPFVACLQFSTLLKEVFASTAIETYLTRYDELFQILSRHGKKNATIFSAFNYYFGFATQKELGYQLENWVATVYPEPIHSAAVDYYYLASNTTALRRIISGYLLKKILTDSQAKINGTLVPSTRKMFIYSGHEMNIAFMILSLELTAITDIPPYGSYVLFELHQIDGVWGLKLFYQFYKSDDPVAVKIFGCDYFCPYDQFYDLVKDLLPDDDSECFGS